MYVNRFHIYIESNDANFNTADDTDDPVVVRKLYQRILPASLADMVERRITHLNPAQQLSAVMLLHKFFDVFSVNSDDLEKTSVVEHWIRHQPRRVPLGQRK